eukprot:5158023-Pleurochrysis_carterae.AAC.2
MHFARVRRPHLARLLATLGSGVSGARAVSAIGASAVQASPQYTRKGAAYALGLEAALCLSTTRY